MTPNKLICKFKYQSQSCLQENVYIIVFQSGVNRHAYDFINFINNVILINLLVM